jgi:hypothetical protein
MCLRQNALNSLLKHHISYPTERFVGVVDAKWVRHLFEVNRVAPGESFSPYNRHREYRQLYNRALSSADRHRADADAP